MLVLQKTGPPDLTDIGGQALGASRESRVQVPPPPFSLYIVQMSYNVPYNAGHCALPEKY